MIYQYQNNVSGFSKQQKNATVLKNAFRVFQLVNERYEGEVVKMASAGDYKEAADCAVALQLFDHFDIDIFIKPLILADKVNTAEHYLCRSPRY